MTEYPWEPRYGFLKTDPVMLAAALESARRRLCLYGPEAEICDCKYGIGENLMLTGDYRPTGEQTGCPELRSAIHLLLHPRTPAPF